MYSVINEILGLRPMWNCSIRRGVLSCNWWIKTMKWLEMTETVWQWDVPTVAPIFSYTLAWYRRQAMERSLECPLWCCEGSSIATTIPRGSTWWMSKVWAGHWSQRHLRTARHWEIMVWEDQYVGSLTTFYNKHQVWKVVQQKERNEWLTCTDCCGHSP